MTTVIHIWEKVHFYEEQLTIPYYKPDAPDTLPPLIPEHTPRAKRVYPYALYELTGDQCLQCEFTALILENRFLKLTVLPELGGRLISIFDKISNQELLFRNPLLKPVMAGLTGAWCGTGMEFNFPGSHSVTSNLPVHCHGQVNPDGSASIVIADREMLSGMSWRVRLTLHPHSDTVFQESEFCNHTAMPHPAYWWNNAKVPAYPDTEFILPKCAAGVIHPPMDITRIAKLRLPYVNEINISYYRSVFFQLPLFFLELSSKSFGVYHREHGFGLLHYGDYGTLSGRKIWTLGTGDDGQAVTENLTDDNRPNIEIQAGPLPIQTDYFLLRPGESFHWRESWLPLRNMRKKHLGSNTDFTISQDKDGIQIQCYSKRPKVAITAGNTEYAVFDSEPGKMFAFALKNDNFSLRDRESGFLLWTPDGVFNADPVSQTSGDLYNDADEKFLWGRYREETGHPEQAASFYHEALSAAPGNVNTLNALAVRELRYNQPEKALEYLNQALQKDRRNTESAYYSGVAELLLGRNSKAVFHLERACFDPVWCPAACAALGRLYLKLRKKTEMDALLENSPETEKILELAIIYHRLQKIDNMKEIIRLRNIAPENPLPDFESGKCPVVNDPMKLAILSAFYLALDLREDSMRLAAMFSGSNPILDYLAGRFAEAEKHSLGGIFPPSELEHTFAYLLEKQPGLPKLNYYYGVTLAANDNWEAAAEAWEKSRSLGCTEPELFRNLGVYYNKIGDKQRAVKYYAAGFNPKKVNYKYIVEYDKLLDDVDDLESRRKILSAVPQSMKNNLYILVRRASLAAAEKQWKHVLELLDGHHFVLCEGKRMTSTLFIQANCALGCEARRQGDFDCAVKYFRTALSYPHNLGVGRSVGKFDMKVKFLIVETLFAAGRNAEAEKQRMEYLDECKRFAIDFEALSTIRRECGNPCNDPLIEENQLYFEKLISLTGK